MSSINGAPNGNGNGHSASPLGVPAALPPPGPASTKVGKVTSSGAILTGGYNTHKVYIGNLPETATLADLEDCFGQLGQCTCSIKRGFGFVEYTEAASAAEAVAKYHEGHFLGAQIKVELSLARQAPPKPVYGADDSKPPSRNPPGSDRPSDSRKPMFINGPPAADKLPGVKPPPRGPRSSNGGNTPSLKDYGPSSSSKDFRRDGPPSDRYSAAPPGPLPRDLPPRDDYRDARYREDFRDARGPYPPPPAPYSDPRDFDRDYDRNGPGYAPPSSRDYRAPAGYGPPPPFDPRDRPSDPRDRPYDPYYDAPSYPHRGPPPPPLGAPDPPYGASARPYAPLGSSQRDQRDPYPSDRDRYDSRPPPGAPLSASPYDQPGRPSYPHDPYGPPSGFDDRYDPRGAPPLPPRGGGDDRPRYNEDRYEDRSRFNAYPRSPPRDDRRDTYGGRSPLRGAPSSDRRRSLSPRRRDDGFRGSDYGPPPSSSYNYQPSYSQGGRSPPRYPQSDEYNPRR